MLGQILENYVNSDTMIGQWVAVYRNLHKNCFSVQINGKVVAYVDQILLKGSKFRVGQKGRQRVLIEGRKNVHAKIYGTVIKQIFDQTVTSWPHAYYDPYKYETFVDENLAPIEKASLVLLSNGKDIQYLKEISD